MRHPRVGDERQRGGRPCAVQLLDCRRGKLAKERVYPLERDVSEEEARVGVFVCHCGANIGRVVDVPCGGRVLADPGQRRSRRGGPVRLFHRRGRADREDHPREGPQPRGRRRLHPEDARAAVPGHPARRRDQPVLLRHGEHPGALLLGPLPQKEEATQKAKDIVRMSVARTSGLEPLEEFELPVDKTALVVGGGVAGMTSALEPRRPGLRGLPGGEGEGAGRHGAEDPPHARRARRARPS